MISETLSETDTVNKILIDGMWHFEKYNWKSFKTEKSFQKMNGNILLFRGNTL